MSRAWYKIYKNRKVLDVVYASDTAKKLDYGFLISMELLSKSGFILVMVISAATNPF